MKKSSLVIMCIFLLVIGNSACSNKKIEKSGKSKSEKNTVMETAPYDDENEPVTVLEQDIVNTEFHEISGEEFLSYIKTESFTKDNWKDFFILKKEPIIENGTEVNMFVLRMNKIHQKKDFCLVFDIKNENMRASNCVFEKNIVSMEWGNKRADGKEVSFSLDDMICKRAEGKIIYADVSDEIWSPCNDGTDRKGFRVKDGEKLYEFYDDGTPVKLDMFI